MEVHFCSSCCAVSFGDTCPVEEHTCETKSIHAHSSAHEDLFFRVESFFYCVRCDRLFKNSQGFAGHCLHPVHKARQLDSSRTRHLRPLLEQLKGSVGTSNSQEKGQKKKRKKKRKLIDSQKSSKDEPKSRKIKVFSHQEKKRHPILTEPNRDTSMLPHEEASDHHVTTHLPDVKGWSALLMRLEPCFFDLRFLSAEDNCVLTFLTMSGHNTPSPSPSSFAFSQPSYQFFTSAIVQGPHFEARLPIEKVGDELFTTCQLAEFHEFVMATSHSPLVQTQGVLSLEVRLVDEGSDPPVVTNSLPLIYILSNSAFSTFLLLLLLPPVLVIFVFTHCETEFIQNSTRGTSTEPKMRRLKRPTRTNR